MKEEVKDTNRKGVDKPELTMGSKSIENSCSKKSSFKDPVCPYFVLPRISPRSSDHLAASSH